MADFDFNVFGKKKYSDILKEIHDNSKNKEEQISTLISELKPMITNVGEATILVPLLAKYLEMGIKNDDNLIKLAGIIQRANTRMVESGEDGLSDNEKQQLLDAAKKLG